MYRWVRQLNIHMGKIGEAKNWSKELMTHFKEHYAKDLEMKCHLPKYGHPCTLWIVISSKTMQSLDEYTEERLHDPVIRDLLIKANEFILENTLDTVLQEIK